MSKIIIVFDGFCVLCNKYVSWVSERNPSNNIYFTNFNSVYIKDNYPEIKLGETVFVIKENEILEKSAAIKVCIKSMDINPTIKFLFIKSPNFLLNVFYNIIAKNRYMIFGKYDICTVPKNITSNNILN